MKLIDLISEDKKTLSMGRSAFWLIIGVSMYYWIVGKDIPQNLYNTLLAVLGYNLGQKAIAAYQEVKGEAKL